MAENLVIHPADNVSVTITIRTSQRLVEQIDSIAESVNMSRNMLINKAIRFALDNIKIEGESD